MHACFLGSSCVFTFQYAIQAPRSNSSLMLQVHDAMHLSPDGDKWDGMCVCVVCVCVCIAPRESRCLPLTQIPLFPGYPTSVFRSLQAQSHYVGPHAVKIVGWGIMTDGTPYWKVSGTNCTCASSDTGLSHMCVCVCVCVCVPSGRQQLGHAMGRQRLLQDSTRH